MNPSDQSLKLALAKMLPEQTRVGPVVEGVFYWTINGFASSNVKDTEMLHVCWLVEQEMSDKDHSIFQACIMVKFEDIAGNRKNIFSPSWQSRAIALAKVKGIEI